MDSDPLTVYNKVHAASFNRVARVFWEHLLFDRLASVAGFHDGPPRPIEPEPAIVSYLFKKEGVSPVRVILPRISLNTDRPYFV